MINAKSADPKANHKKSKKQKKTKSNKNDAKKTEKINNYVDNENKYLNLVIKKVKKLQRKIRQCEKIKSKIDEKVEVQKEEMEIYESKEKMEYFVEELEKLLFKVKEISLEEKTEKAKRKKEKAKKEKMEEISLEKRVEKLEKELTAKARLEMEEALMKKDKEHIQNIQSALQSKEHESIMIILSIYFSAKFIESLNESELKFLLEESRLYLQKTEQTRDVQFIPLSNEDLNYYRSFVLQIFPSLSEIDSIKSTRDELANSARLISTTMLKSEDPVDGVATEYSYRRMSDVADAIMNSSLFYNRFNTKTAKVGKIFDAMHSNQTGDRTVQDNENEKQTTNKNKSKSSKKTVRYLIPSTVPVSGKTRQQPSKRATGLQMRKVKGEEENSPSQQLAQDSKTQGDGKASAQDVRSKPLFAKKPNGAMKDDSANRRGRRPQSSRLRESAQKTLARSGDAKDFAKVPSNQDQKETTPAGEAKIAKLNNDGKKDAKSKPPTKAFGAIGDGQSSVARVKEENRHPPTTEHKSSSESPFATGERGVSSRRGRGSRGVGRADSRAATPSSRGAIGDARGRGSSRARGDTRGRGETRGRRDEQRGTMRGRGSTRFSQRGNATRRGRVVGAASANEKSSAEKGKIEKKELVSKDSTKKNEPQ